MEPWTVPPSASHVLRDVEHIFVSGGESNIRIPLLLYQWHEWAVFSKAQRHTEEIFIYRDMLQFIRSDVESDWVASSLEF